MIPDGSINTDVAGIPRRYVKSQEFRSLIVMQSAHHSKITLLLYRILFKKSFSSDLRDPKDFSYTVKSGAGEAHLLRPLSRRGLQLAGTYCKPAVLVTGPTAAPRTRRFFPSSGRNHRQYSLHLPTQEWSGWVGLSGLAECRDGIDPSKVTNPSTNRARFIYLLNFIQLYSPICCYS